MTVKEQPPFPPATFEDRVARVRHTMAEKGLDALLVTSPENIYYLSAFHTPAYDNLQALFLPAIGDLALVNIFHESECLVAARAWVEKRIAYRAGGRSFLDCLRMLVSENKLEQSRLGVEKGSFFLRVQDYEGLRAALPHAAFVDSSGIVECHRAIKSPEEIAYIRAAARVCEAGMQAGVDASVAGQRDCDVAAAVHEAIVRAGGDYMSYPPFVNVGWHSSIVHNTWSGKRLEPGELVFLEISGVVKRYGAALMRSVAIGKVSEEIERRNAIVHEVLEATIQAIRPGVTSGHVHGVCRDTFAKHGYTMIKRAGYSMGINFPPGWGEGDVLDLSHENPTVLQPGMVFHIPQPYRVPNEQTVSTSETVLVTETGCEAITQFPRQLFRK
jgi:Xaa-Pro dipeptidase